MKLTHLGSQFPNTSNNKITIEDVKRKKKVVKMIIFFKVCFVLKKTLINEIKKYIQKAFENLLKTFF